MVIVIYRIRLSITIITLVYLLFGVPYTIGEESNFEIRACIEHLLNETLSPKLIEVPGRVRVLLYCNFCGARNNRFRPKLWYYRRRGKYSVEQEIIAETNNNKNKRRTFLTSSRTLVIDRFENKDAGIYSCTDFDIKDNFNFTYILDVTFKNPVKCLTGYKAKWQRFKRQKIDFINNQLIYSNKLNAINDTYKISYCWENWEPCDFTTRRQYRKRLGKCCLHPSISGQISNQTMDSFLDQYDILCRSLILNEINPGLSQLVRNLSDFQIIEPCDRTISTPKLYTTRKPRSTTIRVKSIIRKIPEYGHLALACNVIPWNTNIHWYKNNKLLNDSYRKNMASDEDPHLYIDTFNTLYILHATQNERGIFTCTSNGVIVQKVDVRVLSTAKLLNRDFLRYSIYLAFVLSLTVTCYCAGICVAWHQRASFADPLNLNLKKKEATKH